MKTIVQSVFAGVALAAAFAVSTVAFAQPQTVRIRGPIQAVDGSTITVKAGEAGDVKVKLADNVAVFGVVKATLADIKPGVFIGVGATPQADGSAARHPDHDLCRSRSAAPARVTGRGIGRAPP